MNPYEIEICIETLAAAKGAQQMGADRVELCSQLEKDGLTPSEELLKAVRSAVDIGVFVMIRPREGHFHYAAAEVQVMLQQIHQAYSLGADGIVAGCLTPEGNLDEDTLVRLLEATGDLSFTFHRAFDVCRSPIKVARRLEAVGVQRLLSSGQRPKAIQGIALLQTLQKECKSMGIMAGSGVNGTNVSDLAATGIQQFHFTAHRMGTDGVQYFDADKVRQVNQQLGRK